MNISQKAFISYFKEKVKIDVRKQKINSLVHSVVVLEYKNRVFSGPLKGI